MCIRKILALFLSVFSSAVNAGSCNEAEARYIAHSFYVVLDREKVVAVPNSKQISQLQTYISQLLIENLNAANLAEEKEFKRSGGNEPPLYEGSLFSAWPEGYDNFYVASAVRKNAEIHVEVKLQFSLKDIPFYDGKNEIGEWVDTVIVQSESGSCKIDDIKFSSNKGINDSLRARLESIKLNGISPNKSVNSQP